jgi:rod shape-determining protein MreC
MILFSRKRKIVAFVLPLLLALTFFSFTSNKMRRAPWYKEAAWNLVAPPQMLFTGVRDGIKGSWHRYVALVGIEREREALTKRVASLEGELARCVEVDKENERLRSLLSYQDAFPQETVVATVIANDPRAEFKSITINRGTEDGIRPLMPVVGPKGLVGKVGTVGRGYARILLVTDPNSAVDGLVQRSRARGIVVGAAWRAELESGYYIAKLEYLRRVSDIRDGDVVVTSGFDQVFPPGIPIGTVRDVGTSRYGVFTKADVIPFEDMAELQQVLVIKSLARAEPANRMEDT